MVASLVVLSAISLRAINRLGVSLDGAVNSSGKKLDLLGRTRDAFRDLKERSMRTQIAYMIAELEAAAGSGAKTCSACHAPAGLEESSREIEAAGLEVRRHSAGLQRLNWSSAARGSLEVFDSGAARWVEHNKEYLKLADAKKFEDAHAVLERKLLPLVGEVEAAAERLAAHEAEALAGANESAKAEIAANRWAVFVVIGLNVLMGGAMFWLVFRITSALRRAADGISRGAGEVSAVAAQVMGSSASLAQGASEQAASLQETSASSVEVTAMARRNSENSQAATVLLSGAQQQFRDTHAALEELVTAMEAIDASSVRISRIIKVIDEIAFQTSILALNAAVEAARAGDAGAGFAVVADEVRNLAQRCAQAARDTSGLIEESIGRAQSGREKADRVAAAIQAVSAKAATIKELVDEVSAGSRDQSVGLEQVAAALAQIESVTRTTAAGAEQNAAAGQELNAQSASLQKVTEELRVMVHG